MGNFCAICGTPEKFSITCARCTKNLDITSGDKNITSRPGITSEKISASDFIVFLNNLSPVKVLVGLLALSIVAIGMTSGSGTSDSNSAKNSSYTQSSAEMAADHVTASQRNRLQVVAGIYIGPDTTLKQLSNDIFAMLTGLAGRIPTDEDINTSLLPGNFLYNFLNEYINTQAGRSAIVDYLYLQAN